MSTKFYVPRHATDVAKTAAAKNLRADTDSGQSVLVMLAKMNEMEPLKKGNWKISITNYDGTKTLQKSVNWKYLMVNVTAQDLFHVLG